MFLCETVGRPEHRAPGDAAADGLLGIALGQGTTLQLDRGDARKGELTNIQ